MQLILRHSHFFTGFLKKSNHLHVNFVPFYFQFYKNIKIAKLQLKSKFSTLLTFKIILSYLSTA